MRPFRVGPDLLYCFLLLLHDIRQVSVDLVHLHMRKTNVGPVSYLAAVPHSLDARWLKRHPRYTPPFFDARVGSLLRVLALCTISNAPGFLVRANAHEGQGG